MQIRNSNKKLGKILSFLCLLALVFIFSPSYSYAYAPSDLGKSLFSFYDTYVLSPLSQIWGDIFFNLDNTTPPSAPLLNQGGEGGGNSTPKKPETSSPITYITNNYPNTVRGPQGIQGIQGIPGLQGIQGAQGLQGPQGPAGGSGEFIGRGAASGATDLANSLAQRVSTALLNVSGNGTIGGDLNVTGTITGSVSGSINPGFTAGSVIFQGASGLAQDNANFFYDSTNHRLGIGTTTPSSPLTLYGSNSSTNLVTGGGVFQSLVNTDQTNGNFDSLSYRLINSTGGEVTGTRISGVFTNHTAGSESADLAFLTRNSGTVTEKMRILSNGNVGIGTTSPSYALDITAPSDKQLQLNGTAGQYVSQYFSYNGALKGQLYYDNTNDVFALGSANSSTKTQILGPSGSVAMTLITGGKVGINTTNPAVKFHVVGDGTNTAAFMSGRVGIGTTTPTTTLTVQGSGGGAFQGLSLIEANNADALAIINSGSSNKAYSFYSSGNDLRFYEYDTGQTLGGTGADRFAIQAGGNVGIGITNPGSRLVVKGSTTDSTASALNVTDSSSNSKLFVRNDGNVGIGTANPAVKLSVNGANTANVESRIDMGGNGAFSAILGFASAGTDYGQLYFDNSNNNFVLYQKYTSGDLLLGTNSTTNMTIKNGGNVGIGTASPTNILSLGNTAAQKFWIENSVTDVVGRALTVAAGGTVAGTSVSNVTGGNLILQSGLGTGTGASTISFQTGTTLTTGTTLQTMSTKMTILGSGNVGIGTTAPASLLQLATTRFIDTSSLRMISTDSSGNPGTFAGTATGSLRINPAASSGLG